MGKVVEFKAVGLTFVPKDAYPENLLNLHKRIEAMKAQSVREVEPLPRIPARLVRDPDNPADANAVEVHVPLVGRASRVGFVPAWLAAKLAPTMDRGDEWEAYVDAVLIDPDHPDRPGINIIAERTARSDGAPNPPTP